MLLANMLKEKYITENLRSDNKVAAIDELLDLLKKDNPEINIGALRSVIVQRENVENTSYGHGFAFPHARTDEVDDMYILLGISKSGFKEKTLDNVPVSVIVLLLTPSHISRQYLQTLSAFANFARLPDSLERLFKANNSTEVISVFMDSGVSVEKELMVKDLMRRHMATVSLEFSLKEVANIMFLTKVSALPVVDADKNLLGHITDKDLIQAALPDYKTLISNLTYSMDIEPFEELLKHEDAIKVEQLYKSDHETTTPETKIVEVAAMMIFKNLKRVYVVDNNKLVGILFRRDIVSSIIRG
jgi:nitrogen PTS system EIIA component